MNLIIYEFRNKKFKKNPVKMYESKIYLPVIWSFKFIWEQKSNIMGEWKIFVISNMDHFTNHKIEFCHFTSFVHQGKSITLPTCANYNFTCPGQADKPYCQALCLILKTQSDVWWDNIWYYCVPTLTLTTLKYFYINHFRDQRVF